MLEKLGVPADALTLLAVPFHKACIRLDQNPPTVRFLRDLEQRGACVVMHGLTHRMDGRVWSPGGIVRGYLLARGQAELYNQDAVETARRLDRGQEILYRAGLIRAAQALVAPGWLLPASASQAVAARGFDFYETLGGIVSQRGLQARRLVGWEALGGFKGLIGTRLPGRKSRPVEQDMRLAIHASDVGPSRRQAAIRDTIGHLLPRMRLSNYRAYLSGRGKPLTPVPTLQGLRAIA